MRHGAHGGEEKQGRMCAKVVATGVLVLSVCGAAPVLAHHGWSEYDSARPLTLSGVIERSEYEHPHGTIQLKTAEKTWTVVLAPPTRMKNRGLPAAQLAAGNQATVVGYPKTSDPRELRAERITIEGTTTELR